MKNDEGRMIIPFPPIDESGSKAKDRIAFHKKRISGAMCLLEYQFPVRLFCTL